MAMNEETLDDRRQVNEQVIRGIFKAVRSGIKDRVGFVRLDALYSFFNKIRGYLFNLKYTLAINLESMTLATSIRLS